MEVNDQTLSEQNESVPQTETSTEQKPAVDKTESQEIELAEQNESSEKVETIEQKSPKLQVRPKNLNLEYRRHNGQFVSKGKWNRLQKRLKNINKAARTSEIESEPAEPPPPPEPWSANRLRQNGRELVLNRIQKTCVNSDKSEISRRRKRILRDKRRAKRLSQKNRSSELSLIKVEGEQHQVDMGVKVIRHSRKGTQRQRYKALTVESAEHRSLRLERLKRRREMETEEQRYVRLERIKMATLKRRVTETEEQRSIRLERQRRARKLRYWREKSRRATQQQDVVQQEVVTDEDQKIELGEYEIHSIPPVREEDEVSAADTFATDIGNLISQHSLNEEIATESPTYTERLTPANGFAELTLVKVEKVIQIEEECAERPSLPNGLADLSLVKMENDHEIAIENVEQVQQDGFAEFSIFHLEEYRHQVVKVKDRTRIKKARGPYRRKNARAPETAQQRSLRLERSRVYRARRRAIETEDERLRRIERHKMSRIHRLVAETEEERFLRLERSRMANAKRRETETEEERSLRKERMKIANAKRYETETEHEKLIRLERERRSYKIRYLRQKNRRAAQQQNVQLGMTVETGDHDDVVKGGYSSTEVHEGGKGSLAGTFLIDNGNSIPEF